MNIASPQQTNPRGRPTSKPIMLFDAGSAAGVGLEPSALGPRRAVVAETPRLVVVFKVAVSEARKGLSFSA
jgi:hypothetical protein